jgi:thiol-disulfide isomerase/thioredoxin
MLKGVAGALFLVALVSFANTISAQSVRRVMMDGRFVAASGAWVNSPAVSNDSLRGKVVLVNFWTYSCINSLRALPYVEGWAEKYKADGLVVIGVHTPEFSFEKDRANVETAVRELKLSYPVVMDSDYGIWNAFNNEYWPAFYLIDGTGRIRHRYFGEGQYGETERDLQNLLKENGDAGVARSILAPAAAGIEAAPSAFTAQSPETYIGYNRAERFVSPAMRWDVPATYTAPTQPGLNQWGLSGSWNVGPERGVLQTAPGRIVFRFHSRDLHLVMGPAKDGKPVRFRVLLDGNAPGADSGVDTAPDGTGVVREPRLHQLIRQRGPVVDRTFEIEFLDPGVQAYVFTFG